MYTKKIGPDDYMYLLLYVDDMLLAARNMSDIDKVTMQLSFTFKMKDLRGSKRIIGMDIVRDKVKGTLCLSQSSYLKNV